MGSCDACAVGWARAGAKTEATPEDRTPEDGRPYRGYIYRATSSSRLPVARGQDKTRSSVAFEDAADEVPSRSGSKAVSSSGLSDTTSPDVPCSAINEQQDQQVRLD